MAELKIINAGIIGSGTMGAGIAAHLANCGIPSLLLDIVPSELTDEEKAAGIDKKNLKFRNRISGNNIKGMLTARPAPFYDAASIKLITAGNIEDDFDKLAEVDWIIEAVPEKLALKKQIFKKLEGIHHKGQIVTSNTSGLALSEITVGLKKDFLSHVMITHFFNPVRYMHLLEMVACEHTDAKLFKAVAEFAERDLGKGAVIAKDTPNFIGNRIGCFDVDHALILSQELGLSPSETDAIAGPMIGRPKSGVYRLLDLIGIDIMVYVNENLYGSIPDDESREVFGPIPVFDKMMDKGLLGQKSGSGFYKKSKDAEGNRVILELDTETFEYGESAKVDHAILAKAKGEADLSKRLKMLVESDDVVGKFVWGVLSGTLCYAANRVPEICDDIVGIDNGVRWGFSWDMGPFELWDAIGVRYIADRLKKEGKAVPEIVKALLDSGQESFYGFQNGKATSFSPVTRTFGPVAQRARVIQLSDLKKAGKVVKAGKMASIVDLGDGVICLEFHSKANTISDEVQELIFDAVEEGQKNFAGLVVGNQGANFCLGADLKEMVTSVQNGKIGDISKMIRTFQSAMMTLKYSRIPTVAAIHRMVLGGGAELAMQCDRVVAVPETYIGLVELGVGLIPGGGGCKEWVMRCDKWCKGLAEQTPFAMVNKVIEMVGMAKTSSSAAEAKQMGFLRECDGITMNKDSLIYSAKKVAMQLAEHGYQPPLRRNDIQVLGRGGIAEFKVRMNMWRQGNFISEYDEYLVNKLAYILCGGDVPNGSKVTEQHLLDLEHEVFIELVAQPRTHDRIEHMLKMGKQLRN